jgi:hypothetical protein
MRAPPRVSVGALPGSGWSAPSSTSTSAATESPMHDGHRPFVAAEFTIGGAIVGAILGASLPYVLLGAAAGNVAGRFYAAMTD